ncbi:MAG: 23S rRNA (guanosine(2251)-2'-O)-methyltransferase RlmB [Candidatus Izemoplasma sp.]|nr:23S rRNA (guanosine(2251)-2'-O)-methyltransferase RlmB [Candidatus Izemoplasma sp.]
MATKITGLNVIREAIKAKRKIYRLYTLENNRNDVINMAQKAGIQIEYKRKDELEGLYDRVHQNILAEVEDYRMLALEHVLSKQKENKVIIMLDGLEDPHNLGAILRSADAFDVDAVIVPKHRSVHLTDTVIKVSTGAIEYVDVVQVTNLNNTIKTLKDSGFWIAGTDMEAKQTIQQLDVDMNLCVVIGSEGKGMSRLVKKNCDFIVNIPMGGHVNSLNASVSAGIIMQEIYHKKHNK